MTSTHVQHVLKDGITMARQPALSVILSVLPVLDQLQPSVPSALKDTSLLERAVFKHARNMVLTGMMQLYLTIHCVLLVTQPAQPVPLPL
jgi:hypothetical protein